LSESENALLVIIFVGFMFIVLSTLGMGLFKALETYLLKKRREKLSK